MLRKYGSMSVILEGEQEGPVEFRVTVLESGSIRWGVGRYVLTGDGSGFTVRPSQLPVSFPVESRLRGPNEFDQSVAGRASSSRLMVRAAQPSWAAMAGARSLSPVRNWDRIRARRLASGSSGASSSTPTNKPSPAELARPAIDENRIRQGLCRVIEATRSCRQEIIMKDNHTIAHNPENVRRWCRIAGEEAER